jgi:hypothetical protein
MASLRLRTTNIGTLGLALTLASPSIAQSGSDAAQSGAVIYRNAAQCTGGYGPDVYSAHCEPGPAAVILHFKTKAQFSCADSAPVDIRWAIPTDTKLAAAGAVFARTQGLFLIALLHRPWSH